MDWHNQRVYIGPDGNRINRVLQAGISAMEAQAVLEGLPVGDLHVIIGASHMDAQLDGETEERVMAVTGRGTAVAAHTTIEGDIQTMLAYSVLVADFVAHALNPGLQAALVSPDGSVSTAEQLRDRGDGDEL